MEVNKNKVQNKLLKDFEDEIRYSCRVCRQIISKKDIENKNFEYVKNKFGENYAHSSCIQYRK